MIRAFKNLFLGGDSDEPVEKAVSEDDFRKALMGIERTHNTHFLLTLPQEKLCFCFIDGEFRGKSYLWLLGKAVIDGGSGPYLTVSAHLTYEVLCSKPLCGQTLLWMLSFAAFKGSSSAPLMDALQKYGTKLTTDDLNVEVDGFKVCDLLAQLALNIPQIGNLVPDLINHNNCPDDDSCYSAGTLLDEDSNEASESSCQSACTIKYDNDEDDDAMGPSNEGTAQLRMYSRSSKLHGKNSAQSALCNPDKASLGHQSYKPR